MLLLWLLALTNTVAAAPNIGLPINSQVPPVARVSKIFQFIFAESTFTSSANSIGYSLSDSPPWLQLDSTSRTLSGTAPAEAAGPVLFRLIASDETGSTTMEVTLIVSTEPGPELGTPVSDQLAAQGAFSAPDSFMVARSSPLSLSFSKSTFTNTNEKTVYYAISANNTPLPSWISFDPSTLSLTGTIPQSTSPIELSQSYGIVLAASDVIGFSGAVAKFQIVVESHWFSFQKSLEVINCTQELPFNFSDLHDALLLDGRPAKITEIGQVVADIPKWMSLDINTLMISGTPPPSAISQNFTITATSIYGDVASTTLLVQIPNSSSNLFRGSLGTLDAISGSEFEYTIDRSLLASPDVVVTVDLGDSSPWLQFDAKTLRLYGRIPADIRIEKLALNVTASLLSQSESQTITFLIKKKKEGDDSESNNTSQSTHAVASPSTNKSSETSLAASVAVSRSRKKWLPAAIIIPIAMALTALILACFYKRKRRQRRSLEGSPSLEKDDISRPIEQEVSWLTIREDETEEQPGAVQKRESSKAPKLEIKDFWSSSVKRGSRSRWSRITGRESNLSQNADIFQEYVGQNFNAVRPEPAAVQAFNRLVEEHASSHLPSKRCSARSRRSVMSTHSSISEIIPSYRYPRPGKDNLRKSLVSTNVLGSQHISGLGRAETSMGHGVIIMDRGIAHGRADSDMTLGARLSQAGFSGFGGPNEFGLVRATWRSMGAKGYETTEYATTDASSRRHDEKQSDVSSIMRAFPQTPTSNTLNIYSLGQGKEAYEHGKHSQQATVRMVALSPAPSLRREPTLQNFHKQRISSLQRNNPFLSGGAASRASSLSLWKISRKSTGLSRNQSTNSQTSETRGLGTGHQSKQSPYRPSFLSPPNSPHRRRRPPHNRHRLSAFGQFLHTRHRSSISITSSQRYASPEHTNYGDDEEAEETRSESFYDASHNDIEEDIDEDGNRLWRPVHRYSSATQHGPESPYHRNSDIFSPRWSSSTHAAAGGLGVMMEQGITKEQYNNTETPNLDPGKGNGNGNGNGKDFLVVGGARGKRPISIDVQGGLSKGWSMRGDMREGSGSAFL